MSKDGEKYDALPIPTYEEATSSRPPSSQSYRGPTEVSDDAERQGLLGVTPGGGVGQTTTRRFGGNYQTPTVESERSSVDSDFTIPEVTSEDDEDEAELRRDLEQMDVSDPELERRAQQRARIRKEVQKRIASITGSFSRIPIPRFPKFPFRIPSFNFFTSRFSSEGFTAPSGRFKVSWPIIARLCAIMLIAGLVYALVVVRVFPSRGDIPPSQNFIPESVRTFVQGSVDQTRVEAYLRQVSFDDHIAGTKGDFFLSEYIEDHFKRSLLDEVKRER